MPGKQKIGQIDITFMECEDIYIRVDALAKIELSRYQEYYTLGTIKIRDSHYSYDEFKVELVKAAERYNKWSSNKTEVVTLSFENKKLKFVAKSAKHLSYMFTFSDLLKKKLNITLDYIEIIFKDADFKFLDTKTADPSDSCEKVSSDPLKCSTSLNKFLLISRYSVGPHWIKINLEEIIYIPSQQFWTWHLFSDYYNRIFKKKYPYLKKILDGDKYAYLSIITSIYVFLNLYSMH